MRLRQVSQTNDVSRFFVKYPTVVSLPHENDSSFKPTVQKNIEDHPAQSHPAGHRQKEDTAGDVHPGGRAMGGKSVLKGTKNGAYSQVSKRMGLLDDGGENGEMGEEARILTAEFLLVFDDLCLGPLVAGLNVE